MNKRTLILGSAIVAVGVIAVPTAASAANGGAWLLGRSNSESAMTTVTNSAGTPLSLNSKAGYAPLKVNRTNKVTNLNSDLVDGYNASSFAMRTGRTGTITHDGTLDGWGAKCPAGTVFVSGGGVIPTYDDYISYAGPDWNPDTGKLIPNSWIVMGHNGIGVSNVTCYQPSGAAIPGAATTINQTWPDTTQGLAATGRGPALSDTAVAKIAKAKENAPAADVTK